MRWFKKRSQPFDDHFAIHIETPPNPDPIPYFTFTIPDWYYAHLISIQFLLDQAAMGDPFGRMMQYWTSRGSVALTSWCKVGSIKVNEPYQFLLYIGATYGLNPYVYPNKLVDEMPPDLYLYPGDVITIEEKPYYRNDRLKNFILTFRIWEV